MQDRGARAAGGVDVGAGLQQQLHGGDHVGAAAALEGVVQGGLALAVAGVDAGPAVEEERHRLEEPGLGRGVQGIASVGLRRVDVGAEVEEGPGERPRRPLRLRMSAEQERRTQRECARLAALAASRSARVGSTTQGPGITWAGSAP